MIGPGTNLWSADGNYQISADGRFGWSADGYEPTPLQYAVQDFAAIGVNIGQITYQFDDLVPVGWVITGYPPLLLSAVPGSYVNLVVSQGPAPPVPTTIVPDVVGLYYFDAQLAILDAALLTATPNLALSTTVLPGYVISQSLTPGTTVNQQTQMTIVVSGFTVLQQPGIPTPVL